MHIEPGIRFGRLVVVSESDPAIQPSGQQQRTFMCRCDCGTLKRIRLSHLRHSRILSCGCLTGERHGMTGTPLHNTWRAMKMRCGWGNYIGAHLYSKRGIGVCKEWLQFSEFAKWAKCNGHADGLTLDRIDNEKGYSPENCRWVTQRQNCNNRRCTKMVRHNGLERPLTEVIEEAGLTQHSHTVRRRLSNGWPIEKALLAPIRTGKYGHAGDVTTEPPQITSS